MGVIDWLRRWREEQDAPIGETRTVREIVSALDWLAPERARLAAAFAYLLGRVAFADLDISDQEAAEMENLLERRGGLSAEEAAIVTRMAKDHARLFGGTEDFLVAREFAGLASLEQRRALIHCLFAVAAADQEISTIEDNAIKQIADELKIDRGEVSALRAEFRHFLGTLKGR